MKFTIVALAAATVVSAQVVNENGEFKCLGAAAGKNFCAGTSLETNIIIRCTGEKGQPGNCNDNLAGVPPVGVKSFAPCFQTSETSGDAACSFNGIAYPDSGEPFPIPGSSVSSSSYVAPTTYESSSSTSYSVSIYPTDTTTAIVYPTDTTTAIVYPTDTTTAIVYPTATVYPTNTTSEIVYPTSIPVYSSSTLTTITGIVTTSLIYYPTGTAAPAPPTNQTTYTSSLPIPTQIPSGAGALLAKDGLILGAVALIGFLFL